MGTRLYPIVSDNNTLELLAGVPEGTHKKLSAIKAEFTTKKQVLADCFELASEEDRQDLRYAHHDLCSLEYDRISDDPAVDNLNHFLLFGWGKFQPLGSFTEYGEETDPVAVAELLALNGICLDGVKIDGLSWS